MKVKISSITFPKPKMTAAKQQKATKPNKYYSMQVSIVPNLPLQGNAVLPNLS